MFAIYINRTKRAEIYYREDHHEKDKQNRIHSKIYIIRRTLHIYYNICTHESYEYAHGFLCGSGTG